MLFLGEISVLLIYAACLLRHIRQSALPIEVFEIVYPHLHAGRLNSQTNCE